MCRLLAVLLILLGCATTSVAHYNMLIPDKAWANKGEKVTFTYQFGHPYEHELFDAPKPVSLVLLTPKGKKEILDIEKILTKIELPGADGKKVTAWQFAYTPAERGDHTFVLKTAKIKHEDNTFLKDVVRVVLHVQTQNGWDTMTAPFERGYDIRPYTRPYGLLPGMVFRGQLVVHYDSKWSPPLFAEGTTVEIEKYNGKAVKNLPPDELVTFRARTDQIGFFVATLPEPGWWGITALTGLDSVRQSKSPKKEGPLVSNAPCGSTWTKRNDALRGPHQ